MKINASDERALDALLVLACLEEWATNVPNLAGPEPELDPRDEQAFATFGSDLIRKLIEEEGNRT